MEAEFQTVYGLYSAGPKWPSEETWLRAEESDRFFRFSKLVGVSPKYRLSSNTLSYLRFRSAFDDGGLRLSFERLSGLRLGSSDSFGCHSP